METKRQSLGDEATLLDALYGAEMFFHTDGPFYPLYKFKYNKSRPVSGISRSAIAYGPRATRHAAVCLADTVCADR